jgi:hypothetical protein
MRKLGTLFQLVFFLLAIENAYSQTSDDSIVTAKAIDSVTTGSNIKEEKSDEASEQYFLPISDTGALSTAPTRKVNQRTVNSYLKNPDYAYANDPEYWRIRTAKRQGGVSKFIDIRSFQWLVFIIIMGVLLYGIYHLAKENNFKWFIRNKKLHNTGISEFKKEEVIDFNAAIHAYQMEGNYRLAVRFMFLKLIQTIRESREITVRDSSTNSEIVLAFEGQPNANEFRYLATAYEYIYYGDFVLREELFNSLKKKFEDFQLNFSV